MSKDRVIVTERDHTDVDRYTWGLLSNDRSFLKLVESGILSVSVIPTGFTRLHASCYVGRAKCDDLEIEIRNKIPGALEALLSCAANSAFRIESIKSPASDLGVLTSLLIQQFVAAVAEYASVSRRFVYQQEGQVGSLAGGRIDITSSVQLRGRGLGHLLAFEKNIISFNTPLNRVVLAALMEVERLSQLMQVQLEDKAKARGLALLFSDCRDTQVIFGDRADLARLASDLSKSRLTAREKDLAALASVLLAHESFESAAKLGSQVPRSWFLNLERLFEQGVIAKLEEVTSPDIRVSRGGESPKAIFGGMTGSYRAHPDIVLHRADGDTLVGDVKYKHWSGIADASDIYQLLVHTSAFGGSRSFLVFPHDEFQAIALGRSVTACDTWLFSLDVANLSDSVGKMLNALEVGRSCSSAEWDLGDATLVT